MPDNLVKTAIYQIPFGERGTEATIAVMRQWVIEGSTNPYMIALVRRICQSTSEGDMLAKAQAIYNWVVTHIKYESDISEVEMLTHPNILIGSEVFPLNSGDCDCISTLVASMLMAIGISVRFVAIGDYNNRSHVFVEGFINNKWVPIDAADRVNPFGVKPTIVAKRVFNITPHAVDTVLRGMSNNPTNLTTLGGYPDWLQAVQKASRFAADVNQMVAEGKLKQSDIDNAMKSIVTTIPTTEDATLNPSTIKNIPTLCLWYKRGNTFLNIVSSPAFKIISASILIIVIVVLINQYQKKRGKSAE